MTPEELWTKAMDKAMMTIGGDRGELPSAEDMNSSALDRGFGCETLFEMLTVKELAKATDYDVKHAIRFLAKALVNACNGERHVLDDKDVQEGELYAEGPVTAQVLCMLASADLKLL